MAHHNRYKTFRSWKITEKEISIISYTMFFPSIVVDMERKLKQSILEFHQKSI